MSPTSEQHLAIDPNAASLASMEPWEKYEYPANLWPGIVDAVNHNVSEFNRLEAAGDFRGAAEFSLMDIPPRADRLRQVVIDIRESDLVARISTIGYEPWRRITKGERTRLLRNHLELHQVRAVRVSLEPRVPVRKS